MNQIIVGAELRDRLNRLNEPMEVCDESGRTLGYFHPVFDPAHAKGLTNQSPFSREEIERRRTRRTGRHLAEILADLSRP